MVDVRGKMAANDMSFVKRACIAGGGIALLPRLVGNRAVAAGLLRPMLPQFSVGGLPSYLVYPSSPYLPLKVKGHARLSPTALSAMTALMFHQCREIATCTDQAS